MDNTALDEQIAASEKLLKDPFEADGSTLFYHHALPRAADGSDIDPHQFIQDVWESLPQSMHKYWAKRTEKLLAADKTHPETILDNGGSTDDSIQFSRNVRNCLKYFSGPENMKKDQEVEVTKKLDSIKSGGGEEKNETAWEAGKLFCHHAWPCVSDKNRGSWSDDDIQEIVLKMWRKDRKRNRPYWDGMAASVLEAASLALKLRSSWSPISPRGYRAKCGTE